MTSAADYRTFLESKAVTAPESSFDVSPGAINPALKPHQRDAVRWAVKGSALWSSEVEEFCIAVTKRRLGG